MPRKTNKKSQPARRRRVRPRSFPVGLSSVLDSKGQKYRSLLLDPCGADLTPAVGGLGATFVSRQRIFTTLTVPGYSSQPAAYTSKGHFQFFLQPAAGRILFAGSNSASTSVTFSQFGLDTGLLTTATASGYRIIAACAKFISTSNGMTRAGAVHTGYIPELRENGASFLDRKSLATRSAINGSEEHEVSWVPASPHELDMREIQDTTTEGSASFILLDDVDVSVGAVSTSGTVNGYIETTYVFEWTPIAASQMPSTPSPASSNSLSQVLSTMGDKIGHLLVDPQARKRALQAAMGMGQTLAGLYMGNVPMISAGGAKLIGSSMRSTGAPRLMG